MILSLTSREFQFTQQYMNEMYQSATLRTGPMGDMITTIRNKFLIFDNINLSDAEARFLLFSLNDTFFTSHSSIVKSQLGNSMQFLRPDTESRTNSQINQDPAGLSGTYLREWDVMLSIMKKLGLAPTPAYQPLKVGPDGDLNAISTPMRHDSRDGSGYNHT